DAKIACDIGVEGCVVSNHGGRQLDGAGTTVYWMPKIADAVGDQMELMMDSGVRTGMDIFKARALGASSVLLGRAMVYALGAQGRQGVERLLELLRSELKTTLALSGKCDVASIEASDVY
ncbi:MAG: alpha-hydroxy-acid oxidizing protein, partial [Pseudomonadota bacterium]